MRCSQCAKFVSYEDPPTVEVQSTGVSADTDGQEGQDATRASPEAVVEGAVDAPVAEAAGQDAVEAEVETAEAKPEVSVSGTVTLEARVVLKCQECGTDLAETTMGSPLSRRVT